jgi:hypothetical protein
MTLSANLGFVDKYSLLLDVHESMLYLTQITDAAADKVDFLIRGSSERVDWTLGVWVHTPRLSAAQQRRQSNVRFTRRDLDAYHDALVCFAEDVEWQWSIGGAQLGVEGDGGGETHLTDAQELWKPAAVPELPQWADLSGDAVLLLKRQKRMLLVAERELTQYGRKVSCWALWVFPCDLWESSEPPPTTGLRREEAMTFVTCSPIIWRWLLGLIASFIKRKGSLAAVIPQVDHPRVAQFMQFWFLTEP